MKYNVRLIFKEIIAVDGVEADSKEEAINKAVELQEEEGAQVDYFWHDAEAEQA